MTLATTTGKLPSPLVGRGPQVAELLLALAGAVKGAGQIVLIEGEAGIGKTVLLEAALRSARSLGFGCCAGAAEELERHRPFGALSDALGLGRRARLGAGPESVAAQRTSGQRSQLAALIADGRRGSGGQVNVGGRPIGGGRPVADSPARRDETGSDRRSDHGDPLSPRTSEAEFAIVDGLIDYVEQLCAASPLALAVDDLHWADPSTLVALSRLAQEIRALPCALIVTLRPLPHTPGLDALKAEWATLPAVRLRLDPLSAGEVATLAEHLLQARPSPALLEELDRAGGNPFLATELIASYQREGLIRTRGEQADLAKPEPPEGLPASLASMIRHRLSFLSEDTIYALEVASVLGSTFSATDLAAVLDRPLLSLLDQLHGAAEAGIISGDGRLVSFRHDLIRESLYAGMPQAVRHSLHLAAANALLEVGLPAVEVADHVLRGAAPGDLEAVEWLRTAARQAGGRAPAIAADLLARARGLITEPGPLRDATLTELAAHLVAGGRLTEAESICRSVLSDDHDPAVEGGLRLCLVQVCVGRGRIGDALPEIDAAIGSPELSPLEHARLRAWSATCRVVLWDLPGAAQDCAVALEASRALGDDLGVTIALCGLAMIENLRGGFRGGLAAREAAVAAARRSPSPEARRLRLTLMHALMLIDVDALDEAQNALRQGRYARERRGARWNLPSYHFVSAIGRYFSGEWDEAIAQFESAIDFAQEVVVYQGQLVGHSLRSMIALHRGDTAVAESQIAAAEAHGAGAQWRPDWMLWAKALKSESEGRVAEAMRTLAIAWRMCRDAGVAAEYPVIGPDLVRLALACGEGGLAEEVTAALEALAEQSDVRSVRGAALRCRGLITGDAGLLLEAVHAYRDGPRRWELALACEDAAVALAGARSGPARGGQVGDGATGARSGPARGGQVGDVATARLAREVAEEALGIYRGLEAGRALARAQARLRAAGLRTGSRADRQRPRNGWVSLTATEQEVAAHVAAGLPNPEIAARLFISRRTVQSHVSHILEKLDLTSRVELAVSAARRGAGAQSGDRAAGEGERERGPAAGGAEGSHD